VKTAFVVGTTLLLVVGAAHAQTLDSQIMAVRAAQDAEIARQNEARAEIAAAAARQAAAYQAAQDRRAATAQAAANARAADEHADKLRDQKFEDQNREIDIEAKKLQLDAMKARVARENDYIDQDLKRKAATTDVIQSTADAKRDIGSGTKALLSGVGAGTARGDAVITNLP
jgi:hypothetical protein